MYAEADDVRIAAAHVLEAQAQVGITRANQYLVSARIAFIITSQTWSVS